MGFILKSTFHTFTNEIMSINLDRNYLDFNNTFPAISVCMMKPRSTNPLRFYLRNYHESTRNVTNFDLSKIMAHVKVAQAYLYHSPTSQMEDFKEYCLTANKSCGLDLAILKDQFWVKECDEAITSVSYQGKNFSCKDLFVKYQTEMGICFTTNSIYSV